MLYDPQGTGAASSDFLVRRGKSWESASRLARQALQAEAAGLGHGVSVTSPPGNDSLARDPSDAVQATRQTFEEAGFEVHYTPSRMDTDHHTIILPNPVTDEWAEKFNAILGRRK